MIRLPAGDRLIRDYWPAEVAWDAQAFALARVFVSSTRVFVLAVRGGRICLVLNEARTEQTPLHIPNTQAGRSEIPTSAGVVRVGSARGCGCSSPLGSVPLPR